MRACFPNKPSTPLLPVFFFQIHCGIRPRQEPSEGLQRHVYDRADAKIVSLLLMHAACPIAHSLGESVTGQIDGLLQPQSHCNSNRRRFRIAAARRLKIGGPGPV